MADIVKITKGQPFALFVPLVILNADGTKESVAADTLSEISVVIKGDCSEKKITPLAHDHYLVLQLPSDLQVAVYAVLVTATLSTGRKFSLRIQRAFEVVNWDCQSNWRDYIVGDHIELTDQPFIAGYYNTDAELERLKEELRQSIEDANVAKMAAEETVREYEQKIASVDDIARETNATANKQGLLEAISSRLSFSDFTIRVEDIISRTNRIYNDASKQDTLMAVALQSRQGFETVLSLLREGAGATEYVHTFANGLYDDYYTISGNLSQSYSKEVRGEVITKSLKMESNTRVTFASENAGTLTLYATNSKTEDYNVKVDGTLLSFDNDGVAQIELAAGSHTITKGTANTFLFFISLKIEEGAYQPKLDIISAAIADLMSKLNAIQGTSNIANLTTMMSDVRQVLTNQATIIDKLNQLLGI